jgi:FdhE protein
MTNFSDPQPDPTAIGEVSAPPFAALPNPDDMFRRREARLRDLAQDGPLAAFLRFIADLAGAQRRALARLAPVAAPTREQIAAANAEGAPAIELARAPDDPGFLDALQALFDEAAAITMPPESRDALEALAAASLERRAQVARAFLAQATTREDLAQGVFAAAGLQVHLARLATQIDGAALSAIGDGLCPVCGSAPGVSMVVGWHGAHGARFCACALCGSLWHYVRIRCVACGSTKGISYSALDGDAAPVKAECCSECGSYVKILYQTLDPHVEPVADDVATLGLDMRVKQEGLRRAGFNPFLIGY